MLSISHRVIRLQNFCFESLMGDGYSVVIDLSLDEIFFVSTGERQLYAFPRPCQYFLHIPTLKYLTPQP